jgi:hypothetical protein
MTLSELKKIINAIDEKQYGNSKVLVDTEAAQFTCHMVDPTACNLEQDPTSANENDHILIIHLDHDPKLHLSDQEYKKLKQILNQKS